MELVNDIRKYILWMTIVGLKGLGRLLFMVTMEGRGRPQMTCDQVDSKDLAQKGIQPIFAKDRLIWKGAISKPV